MQGQVNDKRTLYVGKHAATAARSLRVNARAAKFNDSLYGRAQAALRRA